VRGVSTLKKLKGMSGILKSSYGGKLFLHIPVWKLEWFKNKQI
jgi:hypothetical protein